MSKNTAPIAKITRPKISDVVARKRLFHILDRQGDRTVTWVSSPAGSGKTTLVASWLDARNLPCLWYQVDEGDADVATFFYYMALAAKKAAPRYRKLLPLLTPEYLGGIPVFTRHYFENLYARLTPFASSPRRRKPRIERPASGTGQAEADPGAAPRPLRPVPDRVIQGQAPHGFVIVFDDYQTAPPDSKFHEVMSHGLSLVPEGVRCVVMSRGEPPQAFARLRTNGRMRAMGWDELRLSEQETGEIVRMRGPGRAADSAVRLLHEKAGGWAAGLVLLLESAGTGDGDEELLTTTTAPKEIFDYFASEIFDTFDGETRSFLLKTSFLPQMDPRVVERLTGNVQAQRILTRLESNNFFTTRRRKEQVYLYHALFREFLLSRAEDVFTRDERTALRRSAALLLEETGHAEDAAALFRDAGDWHGLVQLILKQAQTLTVQGRSSTLRKWLASVPEELGENVPWLLFWRGVCTMPVSPPSARNDFGKAFELFKSMQDRAGMFLSWSGSVESSLHEGEFVQLDERIALLDEVFRDEIVFPSPEIEARVAMSVFNALSLRQPHHSQMGKWKEKALALFRHRQDLDINTRLMIGAHLSVHYFYTGDMAGAALVIDLLARLSASEGVSEMVGICVKTTDAFYYLFAGSYQECLRNVYEGMRRADETGVHVWDWHIIGHGVAAALSAGDLETADSLFQKFPKIETARRFDRGYYHYLNAWRSLLRGDAAYALEHMRLCVSLFEAVGFTLLQPVGYAGLAEVLYERGEESEARAYLTKAYEMAVSAKSAFAQYKCLFVRSRICFEKGDEAEGFDLLRKAMRLGKENGLVNVSFWRRTAMADLCMRALEAGIEADYARFLIQKLKLMPEFPPVHVENWPWPLRIYTLGRFELMKDDAPVTFSGKVQKRPLDLLKALVAFGGRDAGEARIIDALWPDSEGDAASSTFKSTLHRLRQLSGREDLLRFQDGMLHLDPRYCWVDAWAFERLVEEAEKGRKEAVQKSLERALAMYRGHFLAGDQDKSWAVSYRERLRKKFIWAVRSLYGLYEQSGELAQAIKVYELGLDVDDLQEEFYHGLMSALHKIGRKAEALSVYERCRRTLQAVFGVAPSEGMEALRCKIRES